MAINERIITGRKFRRLIDKEAKLWQRFSWWSKASDVEFDDGKTAQQKLGNINGITSVFNNRDDIAASIFSVSKVNDKFGGFRIQRGEDGNIYIIDENAGADSVPKKLGDGDPETFDTYDDNNKDFVFLEDTSHAYVLSNRVTSHHGGIDGETLKIQLLHEEPISFSGKLPTGTIFSCEENGFSIEKIWEHDLNYADGVTWCVGLFLFKKIPSGTKVFSKSISNSVKGIIVFK